MEPDQVELVTEAVLSHVRTHDLTAGDLLSFAEASGGVLAGTPLAELPPSSEGRSTAGDTALAEAVALAARPTMAITVDRQEWGRLARRSLLGDGERYVLVVQHESGRFALTDAVSRRDVVALLLDDLVAAAAPVGDSISLDMHDLLMLRALGAGGMARGRLTRERAEQQLRLVAPEHGSAPLLEALQTSGWLHVSRDVVDLDATMEAWRPQLLTSDHCEVRVTPLPLETGPMRAARFVGDSGARALVVPGEQCDRIAFLALSREDVADRLNCLLAADAEPIQPAATPSALSFRYRADELQVLSGLLSGPGPLDPEWSQRLSASGLVHQLDEGRWALQPQHQLVLSVYSSPRTLVTVLSPEGPSTFAWSGGTAVCAVEDAETLVLTAFAEVDVHDVITRQAGLVAEERVSEQPGPMPQAWSLAVAHDRPQHPASVIRWIREGGGGPWQSAVQHAGSPWEVVSRLPQELSLLIADACRPTTE